MFSSTRWLISSVLLAVLLLTGCGGEGSEQSASNPPPPPPVYTIKHYNANLEVIATFEATSYQAYGGCLSFQKTNDPTNTNHIICGFVEGYSKTKPDIALAQNVPIYLIEHRKADGTVHQTYDATNYWIGEGCLFYNDLRDPNTNAVICGFATGGLKRE